MSAREDETVDNFERLVSDLLGFKFAQDRRAQLSELLQERMEATQAKGYDAYLSRLSSPSTRKQELDALIQRVTVNETYFFREPDQLLAFCSHVLPSLWARCRDQGLPLRILSAGASTGEEAYSLAMLIDEALPQLKEHQLQILGVDLNGAVLDHARRGRYSEWSLRQTSAQARKRYFTADQGHYVLDPRIRSRVSFEEKNLVDSDLGVQTYDVIFCRNVFIYFSVETTRRVVQNFSRALRDDGHLFLGSAETLRNLPTAFQLVNAHNAFFYRLGAKDSHPSPPLFTATPVPPGDVEAAPMDSDWVGSVDRSTQRIWELTQPPAGAAGPPPDADLPLEEHLARLQYLRLFRDEDFDGVLAALNQLPQTFQSAAGVQVIRAAALVSVGQLQEAARLCESLLVLDHLNPEAHFILALCRAGVEDLASAKQHLSTAASLDPTFAMPHLHLGLLHRRAKDTAAARASLKTALSLLGYESSERLVLLGGGFNRDGVMQLCKAELGACGGER